MANDPFRPPKRGADRKTEARACRAAMSAVGINPHEVARRAGLDDDKIPTVTFDLLVEYTGFPFVPVVSDEPLDDTLKLTTRFEKTRLYAVWLDAELEAGRSRPLAVIVHGAVFGFAIVYRSSDPPPRPHLCVGHGVVPPIYIEPLSSWCRGVEWAQAYRSD